MDETAHLRRLIEAWLRDAREPGTEAPPDTQRGDAPFPAAPAPCGFDLASLQASLPCGAVAADDGRQEIQEILVVGDWAFLRTYRCLRSTTDDGAVVVERSGHRLSVLHREDGTWRLARDPDRFLAPASGSARPS